MSSASFFERQRFTRAHLAPFNICEFLFLRENKGRFRLFDLSNHKSNHKFRMGHLVSLYQRLQVATIETRRTLSRHKYTRIRTYKCRERLKLMERERDNTHEQSTDVRSLPRFSPGFETTRRHQRQESSYAANFTFQRMAMHLMAMPAIGSRISNRAISRQERIVRARI